MVKTGKLNVSARVYMTGRIRLNRLLFFCVTCLILSVIVPFLIPFTVHAGAVERKTVKVGWHEAPHYITDENGRRSGYSYEYQMKVAAYTGWEYECVEGTWSDLFEMLKKGEIDIMSDVSYTEERARDMLFTSLPMGTEAYYVFVAPDDKEIVADDLSTLNGKKIGNGGEHTERNIRGLDGCPRNRGGDRSRKL
ncbi:MAG: transporter substrate-binding domain-containing protein [Lachnospiraceae bacterium]|nr:transporter substrate-binding domain-containing protein [Lachnospiraceae bacterium]